jgi:hypothetical protein
LLNLVLNLVLMRLRTLNQPEKAIAFSVNFASLLLPVKVSLEGQPGMPAIRQSLELRTADLQLLLGLAQVRAAILKT